MRLLLTLIIFCWSLPSLALELDGNTLFSQTLALNSGVSARVAEVRVVAGQRVNAGDLLIRLDDAALRAARDGAQAHVDALSPRVEQAQTLLDKAQELFDRDSLARVELEDAARELRIAEANLAAARSDLAQAGFLLAQAELRSPIDGIVLEVSTFPGQYLNTRVSDQVLLTIADNRSMIAQALLPFESRDLALLNKKVRVGYGDKSYPGKIVEIGQQITLGGNNHPAVRMKVRFRANGEVPAGLSVRISVDDG